MEGWPKEIAASQKESEHCPRSKCADVRLKMALELGATQIRSCICALASREKKDFCNDIDGRV